MKYGKENKCKACGAVLLGRSDKRFCDIHCKSSFHYKKSITETPRFYNIVDNQLKKNRRILKNYNKSGKAIIRKDLLIGEGFNPNYFTHYWKNTKDDVYLFVYEYGFLRKVEHTVEKYVLIKWQEYMEK